MEFLLPGILSAIGFLILFWKMGARRFRFLEIPIDIAVTLGLAMLFWGTFSGMMTAIIGGIIFSIFFRAMVRS